MKKFLLSLFCLISMAVTSEAENYTHVFEDGQLNAAGGVVTLSGIEWNATSATVIGWNANGKGVQIGSSSNPNKEAYELSTSAFAGCAIKSVTINSCMANGGDATLTINVGNQTSESFALATADAPYTFDCDKATGDITIRWKASAKAYYVSSISIEYTPDASTVTIPAPEFKTPLAVYADKVQVTVETEDQSAVLYYTVDGTTPSYEDYINETGTTKCSKYYVMYFDLTETTTIKAMAVKTDGDVAFKSAVAEQTYVVSRTMPYIPAKEIASGKRYAMAAADSVANFFYTEEAYGNLATTAYKAPNSNYIETVECNGFTFTAVDGGYTIQNHDGRYISAGNNGFNFTAEKPGKDAMWNVTVDANGIATIKNAAGQTIYFSAEKQEFTSIQSSQATADHTLPKLYMQREYPTFTVTPASGTVLERLTEVIVTCDEGIKASSLKVTSEGAVTTFTVTQTNSTTLTLKAKKELTTTNNVNLNIIFTGDIMLDPNGMNMSIPIAARYGKKTLAKYDLVGDAPAATIDNIDPADGSVVEQLSSVVFTFSYYMNPSDDESLQPRLHLEGSSELIPVEYSTSVEDGVKTMTQGAIKITDTITKNGTYILEVPTGYFIDANGKNIEGVTLKYTVKNSTGVEEVFGQESNVWTVYNTAGIKLLETTDATRVKALPAGLYIINGIKSIIK